MNQFEASIRRRKLETDAKESETAEERARKLKQQMSEIGQVFLVSLLDLPSSSTTPRGAAQELLF